MDIPLLGLVPAPGEASIPNGGGTNGGLPNGAVQVVKQISVALIDDGTVQLDQLSRELSTGLELLSMKPTITHFTNVAEYLEKRNDGFAQCDAIVVGYSNPDMNEFLQQITRLQKECQSNCKICALSSNPLEKAERACLNGLSIRFFPKDRSACGKILNMLSSPDLQKCSSCTRWKPVVEFSGKATCDACRPKKRKQCAGAAIDKRIAIDLLVGQHERLRETVEKQNNELLMLRNQVSTRARALLVKRGLKEETCQLNPQPLHQGPPTGLDSNIIQPVVQQPNMQQPILDNFGIPQQLPVSPSQPQEVRDANQATVPNAYAGDQVLHNLAYISDHQQEQQQLLQQQQVQQQQLLQQQQQQQQQLMLHHRQLLQGPGNGQPNIALSMLPQSNTQQQPMTNTLPMTMQHQQVMDGNAIPVVTVSPADQTLHTYMNSFQSAQQQPQQIMVGSVAIGNIDPGDQAQLIVTHNHPAPMEQQHQQGANGNLTPMLNDDGAQNLQMYMNTVPR